jgi:DNA-binding CsgD family transcriptional regulator
MTAQLHQIRNTLTAYELECLKCAVNDMSIDETAEYMCRSPAAIKKYRILAFQKLNCQTIARAIYLVSKNKLL